MKKKILNMFHSLFVSLFFVLSSYIFLFPAHVLASGDICDATGKPPFLSEPSPEINPNLLMIIDNSASMYDIAYQENSPTTNVVSCAEGSKCNNDNDCRKLCSVSTCVDGSTCTKPGPTGCQSICLVKSCANGNTCKSLKDCTDGSACIDRNFTCFTNGVPDYSCTTTDYCGNDYSCKPRPVTANVPCFDGYYKNDYSYGGYFTQKDQYDKLIWYEYDTETKKFFTTTTTSTDGQYRNDYLRVFTDATNKVSSFKATGNFLNWATSSKFDIEKKILTGGKYNKDNKALESEGRGCSGKDFIKNVKVTDTVYFTLGIRQDKTNDDTPTPFNPEITLIDIYPLTDKPFDMSRCQDAIDMMKNPSGFGKVKKAILDCMNYTDASYLGKHDKQALTHALHDCWFMAKHPGKGLPQGFNFEKWCGEVYKTAAINNDPAKLTPENPAYVCYGTPNNGNPNDGYIGECWDTAGNWKYTKKALESCINDARKRFCSYTPPADDVVDPTDVADTQAGSNIPGMLIEQAVTGSLGTPTIKAWEVKVDKADKPTDGLIRSYYDSINFGAMTFNYFGSSTESSLKIPERAPDDYDEIPKDGSKLVYPIIHEADETARETEIGSLEDEINKIKATSWTPLAEAMFNAIGYYTQRSDFRINDNDFDFSGSSAPKPINEFCESNYVLIVTDGESTADLNDTMAAKASHEKVKDDDTPEDTSTTACSTLYGSTYLDDLTYYAMHGEDLFTGTDTDGAFIGGTNPYTNPEDYQNIHTVIVVSGSLENTGSNNECNPEVLMTRAAKNGSSDGSGNYLKAPTPEALSQAIKDVFENLSSKNTASGSAASVVSASRSGEGAVYQALFWEEMDNPNEEEDLDLVTEGPIYWVGDVHAVLVDNKGVMYDDSGGDDTTDNRDGTIGTGDEKIPLKDSTENTSASTAISPHKIIYLWSAAEWLASITDVNIATQRDYKAIDRQRYIFTWTGPSGGIKPFTNAEASTLAPLLQLDAATNAGTMIDWIRGKDNTDTTYRKRKVLKPDNFVDAMITPDAKGLITWRLGDIAHSTPTVVGKPIENYHMLYRDETYFNFVNTYKNRRNVIYFGANDGMLHAVNGGFFKDSKFHTVDPDGKGRAAHALGAELWAYVPYNLLPHLHCLKATDYKENHKYYVDGKPRIFDVQIFPQTGDTVHPGGWGTIMVVGMRFGGTPPPVVGADGKQFISSYIIMDITDPENPPTLLGELTAGTGTANMGYTTGIPAVVPMKKETTTEWYLVIGSGPTKAVDSDFPLLSDNKSVRSEQNAIVGVFPLKNLIAGEVFQIPSSAPSATSAGRYSLTPSPNGFVSDIITVDYDLEKDYRADALYFGTVEGDSANPSGRLYRWATFSDDDITTPDQWSKPAVMFEPGRPITAAPSVGSDGENYWIFFGTGRFFDSTDKLSKEQDYYFGLKEPMDCDEDDDGKCHFLWKSKSYDGVPDEDTSDFEWDTSKIVWDSTHSIPGSDYPNAKDKPGRRKLLRTDLIQVKQGATAKESALACSSGSCLPTLPTHADNCYIDTADSETTMANFDQLTNYIVGGCCDPGPYAGTDGWYFQFKDLGERNVGQATLLGGLLTFTTYNPSTNELCASGGNSFLYGLFYQTGTSWYQSVFEDGNSSSLIGTDVAERIELGSGLAITPNLHVGSGEGSSEGSKAFIQKSDGTIVEIMQPNLPYKDIKPGRTSWKAK